MNKKNLGIRNQKKVSKNYLNIKTELLDGDREAFHSLREKRRAFTLCISVFLGFLLIYGKTTVMGYSFEPISGLTNCMV